MNENIYYHDAVIVTTTSYYVMKKKKKLKCNRYDPNRLKHFVKNYEREHVIFNYICTTSKKKKNKIK
ncbi:hypothetical protein PFNF54_00754 [Plasmodium falciparum NF54]|uniref:Uncharacterized protein n=1 Tax=Plasmodium falciparum (isolate NF54) TaxID=5843 RepID=W7K9Y0_PLAFO|nr:hypothetical protein PFNF54_00754 [Plasmodium falciparum NF54]